VPLAELGGRVAAADVPARVDVPPADVSLKDGYAVQSADVRAATGACPVRLRLLGAAAAGRPFAGELPPGSAIRVLSGACIPPGADAVLAEEFARVDGDALLAVADAAAGRNVLARGTDVALSSVVIAKGTLLGPAQIGLVAAAGFTRLDVVRRPRVGLIAIGDEVVAPGGELREGQVYASNLVTLAAWCAHFGLQACMAVVGDESAAIERQLLEDWPSCDVILTCGGAWRGERDLIAGALARLGWRKLYHHVRLGPGKAAGFGLWREVPVFCLPGGPPSSQAAFLQLALPALLRLAGYRRPGLPTLVAELAEDLSGEAGWTQVVEGLLAPTATGVSFQPRKARSRLQSMAGAQALAMIPEGTARIPRGAFLPVQLLPAALAGDPSGMAAAAARSQAPRPDESRRPAVPPVVAFVARSGAGKTTFLERLIPELVARGLRVGALKHHAHTSPFDVPGKDTYRLSQAGAQVVVAACSVQVAIFRQEDGSAGLGSVIERQLAGLDLVLAEGYKRGEFPKIEIHRHAHHPELLCEPRELLALVTDEPFDIAVPQFSLDDPGSVADFLAGWLRSAPSAAEKAAAGAASVRPK
jgi:molybdopterin molybdotransferase